MMTCFLGAFEGAQVGREVIVDVAMMWRGAGVATQDQDKAMVWLSRGDGVGDRSEMFGDRDFSRVGPASRTRSQSSARSSPSSAALSLTIIVRPVNATTGPLAVR